MKKSISSYIDAIVRENAEYIIEGGYTSIADYIISNAEYDTGWHEYFDDSEYVHEPATEQIDELKEYLNGNYNYLPETNE